MTIGKDMRRLAASLPANWYRSNRFDSDASPLLPPRAGSRSDDEWPLPDCLTLTPAPRGGRPSAEKAVCVWCRGAWCAAVGSLWPGGLVPSETVCCWCWWAACVK